MFAVCKAFIVALGTAAASAAELDESLTGFLAASYVNSTASYVNSTHSTSVEDDAVASDGKSQDVPAVSVNDARWLADCVYYHQANTAQECVDGKKMADGTQANFDGDFNYTVLATDLFTGTITKMSVWNVMFVQQSPKNQSDESQNKFFVVFQGTQQDNFFDWLADIRTLGQERFIDHKLVAAMNANILEWMRVDYQVKHIEAYIGHSAGAEFVKACDRYKFDDESRKYVKIAVDKRGNVVNEEDEQHSPFLITFNPYDPMKAYGRKQIDIRASGDVVSACLGNSHMITIHTSGSCKKCISNSCTSPDEGNDMNVAASHSVANLNLVGVNWLHIDIAADGTHNFNGTPSNRVGVLQHMDECNREILAGPDVQKQFRGQCLPILISLAPPIVRNWIDYAQDWLEGKVENVKEWVSHEARAVGAWFKNLFHWQYGKQNISN